jgi:chemosensory pili system protein ChpA (sensor histidine kinase/response regulator)
MSTHLDVSAVAAFTDEFKASLPGILAALDNAAANRSDRASAREAHRLIHALKGAASMVGLAALGYLLNVAEDLLDRSMATAAPLSDEVLTMLRDSMPQFAAYMDAALSHLAIEPVAIELLRVLRQDHGPEATAALRELIEIEAREIGMTPAEPGDAAHEPAGDAAIVFPIEMAEAAVVPPPASRARTLAEEPDFDVAPANEIPAELAEIFRLEAQEHLEAIARTSTSLSAGSSGQDVIQELRRSVHTLKGAAGVVGYTGAARLAHRMEDLLDRLYEGTATLTPQAVRTLSSSSDALNDLIVGTSDSVALRALVQRLLVEFDGLVGDVQAAEAAPAVAAPPAEDAAPAISLVPQPAAPAVERRRRPDERRSAGPMLRVPLQRLDELVRVVSELVINRSTLEQHHIALIEQVDELKLSTSRLRRVTHKLESDYEVRALGGNMSMVSPGGHGFDDLEFDRYTEFHLLTRELTEITSDIATIGARVVGTIGDFDSDLTRLGRLTREVQDKTMEFRMVPLGTLTTQLERAVRATGESCGKQVEFAIEGEHVALDKSLLEQMADPLLHLLRNAVDHGIESAERRAAAGKPERGRITVRAYHEGTDVLIEVEDDGAGLDLERIRRTAVARGCVTESAAATLGADAVFAYIFEPGFSTADRVTEVSGRGVGMDIVKSRVGRLGGRVYVTSRPGAGTTMSVRVPMTLAITRILLVRAGGQVFGLPLGAVIQIVRPHPTSISLVGAERVFTVDGQTYPLRDLGETLGLPRAADAPAVQPVLIANLSRRRIALAVDEILNSRDAVVKTLGTHLRRVPGIWGATLLGDGTVVLILNPVDLAGAGDGPVVVRTPAPRLAASSERDPYTVLIVDDSLSMRHVLSVAVKKAGWIPVPARDGIEALDIIQRGTQPPDLVLLDIEMPRMDGFEFLATIRGQKGRLDLPIVMLTSRSGDKHRDKATALGVTDYMVKPFQEDALIRNVDRLVRASRMADKRAAS